MDCFLHQVSFVMVNWCYDVHRSDWQVFFLFGDCSDHSIRAEFPSSDLLLGVAIRYDKLQCKKHAFSYF